MEYQTHWISNLKLYLIILFSISEYSPTDMLLSNNSSLTTAAGKIDELLPKNHIAGVTIAVLIQVVILFTTVFLIFIITRKKNNLKNTTNKLILNQTCSDLINGAIFIPLILLYHGNPTMVVKTAISIVNVFIVFASLLSLEAFAVYRYIKVSNPLDKFTKKSDTDLFSKKRLPSIIAVVWLFPLFVSMTPLSWSNASSRFQNVAHRVYVGFVWVTLFVIFVSLATLNALIFRIVREQLGATNEEDGKKNSFREAISTKKKCAHTSTFLEPPGENCTPNVSEIRESSCHTQQNQPLVCVNGGSHVQSCLDRSLETFSSGVPSKYSTNVRRKRGLNKKIMVHKREARMTRLLAALMTVFFISYFPIVFMNFIFLFNIPLHIPAWFQVLSLYTFIVNSAVNPLLCIFMKKDLQTISKKYFKSWLKLWLYSFMNWTFFRFGLSSQNFISWPYHWGFMLYTLHRFLTEYFDSSEEWHSFNNIIGYHNSLSYYVLDSFQYFLKLYHRKRECNIFTQICGW